MLECAVGFLEVTSLEAIHLLETSQSILELFAGGLFIVPRGFDFSL